MRQKLATHRTRNTVLFCLALFFTPIGFDLPSVAVFTAIFYWAIGTGKEASA